MSEWKSKHGVSDQGAFNAGVYGNPSSTYDIARAQAETQKLNSPSYQPYQSTQSNYPTGTYSPGSDGIYWPGVKFIGVLFLIGLIIFGISTADYWERKFINARADRVLSLQTAHYEKLSPEATQMSVQPTAKLYAAAFPRGEKSIITKGYGLYGEQELATAAAWIRYTRDPVSFEKLPDKQRKFIFTTFELYLQTLANDGDINAVRDLRELSFPIMYKATTPTP